MIMISAIHIRMVMKMHMLELSSIAATNNSIGSITASSKMIQFLDSLNFTVPLASE
jgi:hypothetical protein